MELHVNFSNNHFEMSFIPIDFYSLESIFGHLHVKCIKNLNLGIFPNDNPQKDSYYDRKDIYKIFPYPITDLEPLFSFLKNVEDREAFSIYKLEIDFGLFQFLYDDDSYLSLTGSFSTKKDFKEINSIYQKICAVIELED